MITIRHVFLFGVIAIAYCRMVKEDTGAELDKYVLKLKELLKHYMYKHDKSAIDNYNSHDLKHTHKTKPILNAIQMLNILNREYPKTQGRGRNQAIRTGDPAIDAVLEAVDRMCPIKKGCIKHRGSFILRDGKTVEETLIDILKDLVKRLDCLFENRTTTDKPSDESNESKTNVTKEEIIKKNCKGAKCKLIHFTDKKLKYILRCSGNTCGLRRDDGMRCRGNRCSRHKNGRKYRSREVHGGKSNLRCKGKGCGSHYRSNGETVLRCRENRCKTSRNSKDLKCTGPDCDSNSSDDDNVALDYEFVRDNKKYDISKYFDVVDLSKSELNKFLSELVKAKKNTKVKVLENLFSDDLLRETKVTDKNKNLGPIVVNFR